VSADPADELLFLPLGGAGEIGMNLNLYGYGPPGAHRWLMIDCGVSFGGDGIPGADVMMADASFIVERREQLEGLLLTHAHEDHLGAVPYLWPELRCPVFATPFAIAALRHKLDGGVLEQLRLRPIVVPEDGRLQIGPFALELISMTHSIPEAKSVAIRTDLGVVLHTGDWKLDPHPVVGPPSDEDALRRLGDAGITALICDSTNVFERGKTGSEGDIVETLTELVADCPYRVVITCFATNIARLHTIAQAAREAGRDVVMTGASLKRNYAAARECGYLGDVPPFLEDAFAGYLPRERSLIVCTGGQGEPRAALARIAQGEHPYVTLEQGDAVIFSSRVIPGNERAIARLQNTLLRLGADLIAPRQALIHVSGHPAREDLLQMYRLARPQVSVPVHGELRHLLEHAKLAREQQVPDVIVAENGTIVRLAPGPACVIDNVPAGRRLLEGNRLVAADGDLVRSRTKSIYNGAVVVTVVLEQARRNVQDVLLSSIGLVDRGEDRVVHGLRRAACRAVEALSERQYGDDDAVREAVRIAVRRESRKLIDKRPLAHVHLVRV
jgi:ribonuclease J